MKKLIAIMALTIPLAALAQKSTLLIGTYTNTGKSEGIYVYDFDSHTGNLTLKNKATGIENPSYLAISHDKKTVYSVSEFGKERNGSVFGFGFDEASGKLDFKNKQNVGEGPCYVTVDAKDNYAFTANYAGGSVSALKIQHDRSLTADVQTIQHEGSSVNKDRQAAPHVHSTVLSPDNNYLFVSDLGTDKINIYQLNKAGSEKPLSVAKTPYVTVKPGNGPRHLVFHPNKKFAYLVQEMSGSVDAFIYKDGTLKQFQEITMLAPDFKGQTGAAAIKISDDGKFLYASNRGDANEIIIYSIDVKTGKLAYAGRQSTMGKAPRDFSIDPSGNFLLAANQDTDDIFVFKRDKKTGLLSQNGNKLDIGRPVCLLFVK
ncbi:beta-propeller fold lactonase family protein [Pedobacter sp. HMF7647]|uniref:Beta-propeller fold lactonase family protein n=1 Tax=Hufsiella arboris TaxID=2695275 RepID=A0A7K1YCM1_9SPHI|nr:lactonase family protein [Hufsiella arboris]MXV51788.1 beta-propeller fold lactonase family protein [Hufsiella arboris]